MGGNVSATVPMELTGVCRGISDRVVYPLICIQVRTKRKMRGIQAIIILRARNLHAQLKYTDAYRRGLICA